MENPGGLQTDQDHEDHVDGCTCGVAIGQDEVVTDIELPPATGGTQPQQFVHTHLNEDSVCACDVEFTDADATLDEELPVATGGVTEIGA